MSTLPLWSGDTLTCVARIDETADAATFELAADTPCRFDYLPGQFIIVGFDVAGERLYRAYSLSSTPTRPERLAFSVKRVPGGRVSNALCDHLQPGQSLAVLPPAGHFHLQPVLPRRVLLVSSGSGITPMLSIARYLLDTGAAVDIHFLHSAPTVADALFAEELQALAAQHAHFHLDWVFSRAEGRLTADTLAARVPDVQDTDVYLCGSEGFMADVKGWLLARGVPASRLYQESFTGEIAAPAPVSDARWRLAVPAFNRETVIAADETLLEVMEREGLPIIGACRTGVCGSCKCRVSAGEVQRLGGDDLLSADDLSAGYVLACSTRAMGDVTVEL